MARLRFVELETFRGRRVKLSRLGVGGSGEKERGSEGWRDGNAEPRRGARERETRLLQLSRYHVHLAGSGTAAALYPFKGGVMFPLDREI